MKNLYFLCCLLTLSLFAQPSYRKYGKIDKKELQMTRCSFEPYAEAAVLFDYGKSKFVYDGERFHIKFSQHKRIKVFKESGKDHAIITLGYYKDKKGQGEKLGNIKAMSYNVEDGQLKRTYLKSSNIFEEKVGKNWSIVKFVIPNVKKGSIIEYTYDIYSPYIMRLRDWDFQNKIPTLYSQYKVYAVPFFEYVAMSKGVQKFDVKKKTTGSTIYSAYNRPYVYRIQTYGLKNVESFWDESYITSRNDYIKRIDFQLAKVRHPNGTSETLISTWAKLQNTMLGDDAFGKYITKSQLMARKLFRKELKIEGLSKEQKIDSIINYVKNTFTFNSQMSHWTGQKFKHFYKTKIGNAADINLFLLGMLKEAGIRAEPVCFSTRAHGKVNVVYPFMSTFNYVAVHLKNEKRMVDATQPFLSNDLVPPYCINDKCLSISRVKNKKNVGWLNVSYTFMSQQNTEIQMKLNADDLLAECEIRQESNAFSAYQNRLNFGKDKANIKEVLEKVFSEVSDINVSGYDANTENYSLRYNATKSLEQVGSLISVKPLMHFPLSENLLKQEYR